MEEIKEEPSVEEQSGSLDVGDEEHQV